MASLHAKLPQANQVALKGRRAAPAPFRPVRSTFMTKAVETAQVMTGIHSGPYPGVHTLCNPEPGLTIPRSTLLVSEWRGHHPPEASSGHGDAAVSGAPA